MKFKIAETLFSSVDYSPKAADGQILSFSQEDFSNSKWMWRSIHIVKPNENMLQDGLSGIAMYSHTVAGICCTLASP